MWFALQALYPHSPGVCSVARQSCSPSRPLPELKTGTSVIRVREHQLHLTVIRAREHQQDSRAIINAEHHAANANAQDGCARTTEIGEPKLPGEKCAIAQVEEPSDAHRALFCSKYIQALQCLASSHSVALRDQQGL